MITGSHMYARTYLQGNPCVFLQDMDSKEEICQEEEERMLGEMSDVTITLRKTKPIVNSIFTGCASGLFAMLGGSLILSAAPIIVIGGALVGICVTAYSNKGTKNDGPFWLERQIRLMLKCHEILDRIQSLKKIESSPEEIDRLLSVWHGFNNRVSFLVALGTQNRIKKTWFNPMTNQYEHIFESVPPDQWK